MILKTIPLIPTEFDLDVWVCNDESKLIKRFKKRYGGTKSEYYDIVTANCMLRFDSSEDSEMKGKTVFVMILQELKDHVIVHEIVHLLWQMNERIGIEMNANSQEWQAYMSDYVFSSIMAIKSY